MLRRMPVFAVQYDYADRPDALTEVRPAHRAFLSGLVEDGALLASGPFRTGAGEAWPAAGGQAEAARAGAGALLLVRAESAEAAAELLAPDPFLTAGLITQRTVRGWTPVMGPFEDDARA